MAVTTFRGKAPSGSPAREPLSYALGTRAKVACLRVLSTTSGRLTQREVARRAGIQHRSSQLALDELVALGLVRRIEGGRELLVSLSKTHHLGAAVAGLFRSESMFFLGLRGELAAVATDSSRARVLSLVLFGSVARGDDRPGSDVDVLLIVERSGDIDPALARLTIAADRLRNRYGYVVRPVAYTVDEARRRWRRREAPLPEIVRDHIVLAGPPLRELLGG